MEKEGVTANGEEVLYLRKSGTKSIKKSKIKCSLKILISKSIVIGTIITLFGQVILLNGILETLR